MPQKMYIKTHDVFDVMGRLLDLRIHGIDDGRVEVLIEGVEDGGGAQVGLHQHDGGQSDQESNGAKVAHDF